MPKAYTPNDKYFYKAKEAGFRARSVFKLEEIQSRFKLVKKGDKILDLGAAPGSFLQSLSPLVGEQGVVIGIDLQPIASLKLKNVLTFIGDIHKTAGWDQYLIKLHINKFDVITADVAPKTTGIKDVDHYHSVELNEQVLAIAKQFLKPGGSLVTKIFTGEDFDQFVKQMKEFFGKVNCYKPKATRDRSREIYIIAQKKKAHVVSP
jgi:23S rRNA (uridine2552-2'-O)-methyltransferase